MKLLQDISLFANNDVVAVGKANTHRMAVIGNLEWCIPVVEFDGWQHLPNWGNNIDRRLAAAVLT